MKQNVPPVPNIITAAEAWNNQDYEARTTSLAKAAAQGLINCSIDLGIVKSPESDFDKSAFWDDSKKFMTTMPSIAEEIEHSERAPQDFSRIIRAKPSKIINPQTYGTNNLYGSDHKPRSNIQMTEAGSLKDLQRFISESRSVAEQTENSSSQKVINDFENKTGYLSERNMSTACSALAEAWVEYALASPDNVINVLSKLRNGKSEQFILDQIKQNLVPLLEQFPNARDRIIFDSENWRDSDGAKLVAVDDWTMSGATLNILMGGLSETAKNRGFKDIQAKSEAHLLGALPSTLASDQNTSYKIRSDFIAPSLGMSHSNTMAGWHSSVDIGYETTIDRIKKDLGDAGKDIALPHLYQVDRPYSPEVSPEVLGEVDFGRLAEVHQKLAGLPNRYKKLRERQKAFFKIVHPRSSRTAKLKVVADEAFLNNFKALARQKDRLEGEINNTRKTVFGKNETSRTEHSKKS